MGLNRNPRHREAMRMRRASLALDVAFRQQRLVHDREPMVRLERQDSRETLPSGG
jgi:hypothetical protein